MNKIKIIIGCLIVLVLILFGVNQYNQHQYLQEQIRIEAEVKKQNEEIIKNNEAEANRIKSNIKNNTIRRGTL